MTVEALKHAAQARTLLMRQPRVWWNGAPMQAGEQAGNRFNPIESFKGERNERGNVCATRRGFSADQLNTLAIAESVEEKGFSVAANSEGGIESRTRFSACGEIRRGLAKRDDAGIVLREP